MNWKTTAMYLGIFVAGVILADTVRAKVPFADKLPKI